MLPDVHELEPGLRYVATGKHFLSTQQVKGICYESGKDKAAKEDWLQISAVPTINGFLTPAAPTATRLLEIFISTFNVSTLPRREFYAPISVGSSFKLSNCLINRKGYIAREASSKSHILSPLQNRQKEKVYHYFVKKRQAPKL